MKRKILKDFAIKKKWRTAMCLLSIYMMQLPMLAFAKEKESANAIKDSVLFKGMEKLANNLATALVGLSLAVGTAAEVYQFIKLQMAEPEEAASIRKKQKSILIATVGASLVTAILKLLINSYFKAST